jgi:hypothetical protein
MNDHRFVRAYMAGVTVPAAFLLVALTVFCIARFICNIPIPIERAIVFPMALIPNVYGVWNMLYVSVRRRHDWNIGFHGALLPFLLVPVGALIAQWLGVIERVNDGVVYFHAVHVPYWRIAIFFPLGVMVYYLVWKYLVGFLNRIVGVPA